MHAPMDVGGIENRLLVLGKNRKINKERIVRVLEAKEDLNA
jgi:hypothetical protein